jgi:hypothetical protein
MRMVDGCAALWEQIKDWMVGRVGGSMTRKWGTTKREEEVEGGEEEQGEEEEEKATFTDESVARKVYDDFVAQAVQVGAGIRRFRNGYGLIKALSSTGECHGQAEHVKK